MRGLKLFFGIQSHVARTTEAAKFTRPHRKGNGPLENVEMVTALRLYSAPGDPKAAACATDRGSPAILEPVGTVVGRSGKSLVAPHRFRPVTRSVRSGRRDRGLLYAGNKLRQSAPAGEGSPVFREPASPVSAARRAKAQAARRETRAWMPEANVRRRDTGDPEAPFEPAPEKPSGPRTCGWFIGGAGKSFVVLTVPRLSSSVRRSPPRLCAVNDEQRPAPECARWRGVARVPRAGLAGKRRIGGRSAGGSERVEALDGRSERPATGRGRPRSSV